MFDSTKAEADQRAPITAMTLESSQALEGGAMFAEIPDPECALRSDWSVRRPTWLDRRQRTSSSLGPGAAGLTAARTLGRAGKTVTILEARERCGGRIHPLPSAEFR